MCALRASVLSPPRVAQVYLPPQHGRHILTHVHESWKTHSAVSVTCKATNMSGNKLVQMKSPGLAHRRSAHICDAACDPKPHSIAYPASVRHCPGATAHLKARICDVIFMPTPHSIAYPASVRLCPFQRNLGKQYLSCKI